MDSSGEAALDGRYTVVAWMGTQVSLFADGSFTEWVPAGADGPPSEAAQDERVARFFAHFCEDWQKHGYPKADAEEPPYRRGV